MGLLKSPKISKLSVNTANRIIRNTGFLYAKMGITVFISLYTTRLLLSALGAIDFGIFNVVGGAIAMLGFLNAAMAGATQRFMSIAEGEGKPEKKKAIFNISIIVHLVIAIILGLVLVVAGYFFFNGILNIPENRVYAAKVVYGSMIISTLFTVMTVPYEAVLNSYENMLYYAIVGVIESFLKLAVAFVVVYAMQDKLIVYGVLMALISLLVMMIMRAYCHRHYEECIIAPKHYWDKSLMKAMTKFAGWNLLNNASRMISQYGLSIVLNSFFGAILNAAQGIANQISGQLMAFSNTMIKAVSPVIAKSEGAGKRDKMLNTSLLSTKYGYLLLVVFAVPFLLETPYILEIWLEEVPDWAVVFVRLQLILLLIEQLTLMIGRSVEVQGDIKVYFALQSFLNILPIVLTYLFFSLGFPPYYLYIIWILIGGIISGGVAVYFAKLKCGLKYSDLISKVLYPCLVPTTGMLILGVIPIYGLNESFLRLLFVATITTTSLFFLVYLIMSQEERLVISTLILLVKTKIFKIETAPFSSADRTKQHQEETQHATTQSNFTNETDFLKDLHMKSEVRPFNFFNTPRVWQLSQHSNQFNLRAVRYSEADIKRLSKDSAFQNFSFTFTDKFGEYGLICVVILEKKSDETLFIDSWFMSCRVLKRGMEQFTLNTIVDYAKQNGFKCIVGEYVPTAKNSMVKNHFTQLGFIQVKDTARNLFSLEVDSYKMKECYINVI